MARKEPVTARFGIEVMAHAICQMETQSKFGTVGRHSDATG